MVVSGLMVAVLAAACQSGIEPAGPESGATLAAAPSAESSRLAGLPGAGERRAAPTPGETTGPDAIDPRAYAHYGAGVQLALTGRWRDALAQFRRALELDPTSSRIELKIADCLDHLGRVTEALAAYRRAGNRAPNDFGVQFALGMAFDKRRDAEAAASAFERALAAPNADPETGRYALAVWRLAGLAARRRDRPRAITYYNRLLGLLAHPKRDYHRYRQVWALVRHREFVLEELGKLHLLAGDIKAAIRRLEEAKALAPKSVTVTFRLGDAYLRAGEPAKAMVEADRLLDLAGSDAAALDLFFKAALALKQPDEAARRLEARLKAAPDNLILRFYLAQAYRRTDRLAQAEQLLRTVLEAQPRSALMIAELAATQRQGKHLGAAMDTLAEAVDRNALGPPVLREIDRVTKALKSDTPARRAWRTRAEQRTGSRGAQYLLGHLLANLDRYQEAAEVLNRVLRANPTFLWAYVDLASVHARQKNYAEALEVYRSALKHGAEQVPLIHRMMAHLHERVGQLPEAMAAVEKALKLAPDDRRSQNLRAAIFERMGKDREAEQAFRAILAKDPNDPDANNALSYLFATRNRQLDEARRLIDRALRREPDNGAYLDTLGWVLYRQGKYPEALKTLERAVEAIAKIAPDGDPVILDHLGDTHLKLNHRADARRAWRKALELHAKNPSPEIDPLALQKKLDALPE